VTVSDDSGANNPARTSPPGQPTPEASKPKIGDSRPAPVSAGDGSDPGPAKTNNGNSQRRRSSSGQSRGAGSGASGSAERGNGRGPDDRESSGGGEQRQEGQGTSASAKRRRRRRKNKSTGGDSDASTPVSPVMATAPIELDEQQLKRRRGKTRKGRPIGRYLMVVRRRADATHIAILEGRQLIEYHVSRPSDDVAQIHGNIYVGKVQNVLPGMEAAFVDIATPKNAVLYRGDVRYDKKQFKGNDRPKIEQLLKQRDTVICQVTKNPIAHKGARLTTEVSLPGRFVVLVPNSDTYGISKRLPDPERKRLRQILDKAKPKQHGVIVRTAAENVTAEEIQRDVAGLLQQWEDIERMASKGKKAQLLYREPDLSVRVIREEFNKDYRAVVIDDRELYEEIAGYVSVITPALADRVEYHDDNEEKLDILERFHVHEQLHKALDRKVWLPSGGSLIIEATEALTVIDVNTGKNVGKSSLEETVYRNNLEAAEEVAHQLRLRDIGGIIVIDFVDMEDKKNRDETIRVFREALSRDKTRTQVFDISDLGLVEMTRKRIGEGLVESLSSQCPHCSGRGLELDASIAGG
jgi:ribonuclease E